MPQFSRILQKVSIAQFSYCQKNPPTHWGSQGLFGQSSAKVTGSFAGGIEMVKRRSLVLNTRIFWPHPNTLAKGQAWVQGRTGVHRLAGRRRLGWLAG